MQRQIGMSLLTLTLALLAGQARAATAGDTTHEWTLKNGVRVTYSRTTRDWVETTRKTEGKAGRSTEVVSKVGQGFRITGRDVRWRANHTSFLSALATQTGQPDARTFAAEGPRHGSSTLRVGDEVLVDHHWRVGNAILGVQRLTREGETLMLRRYGRPAL